MLQYLIHPSDFFQCMYVKQPSYYVLSLTAHIRPYTSYYDILLHYTHIYILLCIKSYCTYTPIYILLWHLTAHIHTYTSYYDILLHVYTHIHLTMTSYCTIRPYTSYYDVILHIYGHIHLTMTCTCKLRILTYIICICDVSIGKCAFTKVMTNWIHKSDWSWPFCCIHECLHLTAESVVACCAYIWTILLICKYVCMHVCMCVCMYVCTAGTVCRCGCEL